MTVQEMYDLLDKRLEKIEDKLEKAQKIVQCESNIKSCNEKIDLKFKNIKYWTISLIVATGGNIAMAGINLLK